MNTRTWIQRLINRTHALEETGVRLAVNTDGTFTVIIDGLRRPTLGRRYGRVGVGAPRRFSVTTRRLCGEAMSHGFPTIWLPPR